MTALRRILTVGTPGNRLLRFGMLILALLPTLYAFGLLALNHPLGVDLEIPLRAAQRWVDGSIVYDPASFEVTGGAALPYLYPPFLLPFLVPLLALPQELVLGAWVAICLAASVWALRRLRTPWLIVPLLLIWPPFSEGWLGGNVQVVLFALFVSMFVARNDWTPPFRFAARDPAEPDEPALRRGLQATIIAAFKVSQLHPWLYQLRRRPSSAVLGGLAFGLVVLATVPLTGIDLWFEWLDQVRRASDPEWAIGGLGLGRYLGPAIGTAVAVACVAAVLIVPRREAGAWIGVLSVVGSLSLRTYGILFLLPAGYRLRREIGLVAFAFIGTFTEAGMWLGIVIVSAGWMAAQRWSVLLEPSSPPVLPRRQSAVATNAEATVS
ncbi:MAG TPA: glycosyltransferase 87 family protein [Candidatus Limnocylindrales bacterium]|nr:glycosyltransferase 87 family protein [Candidatus Limnocylindrales bacterium]